MKERNEISDQYKWNLEAIYPSIEEYYKDYEDVEIRINEFANYNKTMMESGKQLYYTIKEKYNIHRTIDKLYTYASKKFDSDTRVNKNQELKEKICNLISKFNEISYFIVPNILEKNEKDIEKMVEEYPKLKEYNVIIKETLRYKKYALNKEEEKVIISLEKVFGNNENTYNLLKESDIKFDYIKDEKGKEVELSDSNYGIYIESKDPRVRREAFTTMYKTYKQFINTYASTLYGEIKENVAITKIRKYDSSLQRALFSDELDISVYNNLISVVNEKMHILYKYYDLKKKTLNLEELHLYDIYVPTVENIDKKYPFEEAFEIVKKSLSPLGEEYIEVLKNSIQDRWIDVYPNRGKRSGGYSGGCYDTYPYILLNYLDQYDDMSTLAHELGHSIHSYYSREYNNYQESGYTLFVAEVASTVNELLLAKYMLKNSNSKKEKLYILDRLMGLFKGTLYRQVMFAEFEKEIYELVEKEEVLTAELLCNKYYELNKKYFGPSVCVDEEIKYEWARIPHFYYNFYVYKYATGLSAACYIVNNVIEKGQKDDYINFLKCGIVKNPIDSLKIAGVDLTKKEVIESALNMFDEVIEEYLEISLQ